MLTPREAAIRDGVIRPRSFDEPSPSVERGDVPCLRLLPGEREMFARQARERVFGKPLPPPRGWP